MSDAHFMRRALRLARSGYATPNPHVGCILVSPDGEIIAEGTTEPPGGAHAEVVALRRARERAKGATAYVTLEPCDHTGRTGPCSLTLIAAGVARVVYAASDPNPLASGGAERLKGAGVHVEAGLLAREAEEVHRAFLHWARTGRPLVVLKAGASLDGRIALPSGESRWITGPTARRAAHRLRAELGAVLVGRATVEADDPLLTVRLPGVDVKPLRIVLDPSARLKERTDDRYNVFDASAPTLHVTGPVDLERLVADLGRAGHIGLLVEGGGKTIASFLRAGLADRIELFLAPKLLGAGPAWVHDIGLEALNEAPEFVLLRTRRIGPDLHLTYGKV